MAAASAGRNVASNMRRAGSGRRVTWASQSSVDTSLQWMSSSVSSSGTFAVIASTASVNSRSMRTRVARPRASIALVTGARALAFLYGRDYVLPDDVRELALDVMRHRIVLSYEALADDVTADAIITKVLDAVAEPEVVLGGR